MTRTAFVGANVFDGESSTPNRCVVVDGERIASVGPEWPNNDEVDVTIDVGGRTIMPGMTSGHFHATIQGVGPDFGLEQPPIYQAYQAAQSALLALDAGVTSVVGAGVGFDIDVSLDQAIRDGLLPGPRFVPGGRELITTGDSNDLYPYWYGERQTLATVRCCDGRDEFVKATRDEIKRGVRMIKVYATGGHGVVAPSSRQSMTRDELRAVTDTAHERGARVRAHVANKEATLACLEAGVDVIDHGDGLDDEVIARLAELGTPFLPSLHFPATYLAKMGVDLESVRPDADLEIERSFARMCGMLPKAVASGVVVCTGDDFSVGKTIQHGTYARELETYARFVDVPATEVLSWATRNGGVLAGAPADLGMVRPGYFADLLVVDGDPTADISLMSTGVVAIMKGGRFHRSPLPS